MIRSEKEKMLAGGMYDPSDPQLREEHLRAQRLMRSYNESADREGERRRQILGELLGRTGKEIRIEPPFYCDYGYNISLGENFFANYGCVFLDPASIRIGHDVMLASYVQLYTAYHPVDPAERCSGRELAAPIHIGDRAWLGGGVIVLAGVSIGENTTVGAGSVVTRDLPPNVVAAGNPCRILRQL